MAPYIRQTTVNGPFLLQPVNNSNIFVTNSPVGIWLVVKYYYQFESVIKPYFKFCLKVHHLLSTQQHIRYNPLNGYLYECDQGTRYVNAFDLSLKAYCK